MNTKTILLVEDNSDIMFLYSSKLRLKGYHVLTASDGKKGLECLKQKAPDLALIDLLMPNMTGTELITVLRGMREYSNLPIIILTNVSKAESPQILRFMNIHSYIIKAHTTPTQLAGIVENILNP